MEVTLLKLSPSRGLTSMPTGIGNDQERLGGKDDVILTREGRMGRGEGEKRSDRMEGRTSSRIQDLTWRSPRPHRQKRTWTWSGPRHESLGGSEQERRG